MCRHSRTRELQIQKFLHTFVEQDVALKKVFKHSLSLLEETLGELTKQALVVTTTAAEVFNRKEMREL